MKPSERRVGGLHVDSPISLNRLGAIGRTHAGTSPVPRCRLPRTHRSRRDVHGSCQLVGHVTGSRDEPTPTSPTAAIRLGLGSSERPAPTIPTAPARARRRRERRATAGPPATCRGGRVTPTECMTFTSLNPHRSHVRGGPHGTDAVASHANRWGLPCSIARSALYACTVAGRLASQSDATSGVPSGIA